jgi:hypothetical protein
MTPAIWHALTPNADSVGLTLQQHATEDRRAARVAVRKLTTTEARLDLAHLGGMALEIDRQIATQPRRLAKRWRWSIRAAARLLTSLQRAPVAPAVSAPARVVCAPVRAATGSSVVFVQMKSKVRR